MKTKHTARDNEQTDMADFFAQLFDSERNVTTEGNKTGALISKVNEYLDEHTTDQVDVRAHLIEQGITMQTPPDRTTVAAFRALADALDWALAQSAEGDTATQDGDGVSDRL